MAAGRIAKRAGLLAAVSLLAWPAVALASGPDVVLAPAFLGFIGHAVGSVFHAISGVFLGALHWTVGVAGKFILNTLGGLIRLLIPTSWAKAGLDVMHWIVAVPNYAGTITTPGGHVVYGFAGINALRDLFMWTGAALLPLSLVYATSRAALGVRGHVAAPIVRVVGLAAVLVSYPWWWSQAAALVDQLTHFILALPPVQHGIYRLMEYAVGGVALGGWQLIDLALMGAIGIALLSLIFLKVVVILLGALIYASGPLMIALVPTDGGVVVARAWASAAAALVALPVIWSSILAVGALLINDSATAGPLIAGSGTIASLLGGLLLAFAGLASLWLCLKVAREAGTIVRGQLSGVAALGRGRGASTGSAAPAAVGRAGESLRSFGRRVKGATGAALDAAGPAGQAVHRAGAGVAAVTRGGLIGAAGMGLRAGAATIAPETAALLSRTRAGAAAVRSARAGRANWRQAGQTDVQAGRRGARDGSSAGSADVGGRVYAQPVASGRAPGQARVGGRSGPGGGATSRGASTTGGGAGAGSERGSRGAASRGSSPSAPSRSSGSAAARARRKPRGDGGRGSRRKG